MTTGLERGAALQERKELLQIRKSNCEFSRSVCLRSQDNKAPMTKVSYQDISAYSVTATSLSCRYFHTTLQNNVQSLCFTLRLTRINSAGELQISSEKLDIWLSSSFLQTVSLIRNLLGKTPRERNLSLANQDMELPRGGVKPM